MPIIKFLQLIFNLGNTATRIFDSEDICLDDISKVYDKPC